MKDKARASDALLDAARRRRVTLEQHTAATRLERVRLEVVILEAPGAGATQVAIAEAA